MTNPPDEACREAFSLLVSSLALTTIQPLSLRFDRKADLVGDLEFSISWTQAFPTTDPAEKGTTALLFRPKYSVQMRQGEREVFSMESLMAVAFDVKNRQDFETAWKNEEARKVFFDKQIMKTLWPLLRQQALDGMTRLGLPGIPLPWLVD